MKIEYPRSEASVCSPYKPAKLQRQVEDSANDVRWANSDNPLNAAPPRNVVDARKLSAFDKPYSPPLKSILEEPPKRKNRFAKAVTTVGLLITTLGTVGGLLSMVALGPAGLAVAAACAIVGTIITRAGVRLHRHD